MFFSDQCEVNAQTCSFPPSFGQEKMQPHPSPERVEKVADSESMAEATMQDGETSSEKLENCVGFQKKYMMNWAVFGVFGRFWKKPANVGVHPFQSI